MLYPNHSVWMITTDLHYQKITTISSIHSTFDKRHHTNSRPIEAFITIVQRSSTKGWDPIEPSEPAHDTVVARPIIYDWWWSKKENDTIISFHCEVLSWGGHLQLPLFLFILPNYSYKIMHLNKIPKANSRFISHNSQGNFHG